MRLGLDLGVAVKRRLGGGPLGCDRADLVDPWWPADAAVLDDLTAAVALRRQGAGGTWA